MYTKHVTYQFQFFRFTIIREHHLFVSFVASSRLMSLCYILVALYWGWNDTDNMTHADYYIDVGLLRVFCDVSGHV